MDFEITPEQQELIDSVRSVLAHECPTALARDVVENGSAPEQPWRCARELGWTSIDLPETLGGFELGFTALGLVIEQHGCCIAPGRAARLATEAQGVDGLSVEFHGMGEDESGGEMPWLKRYLQSYGGTISAGASEIQRNIIAQRVLGLARR